MTTPGSRKWSVRRIRSPSKAPFVNGDDGSIDKTATFRSRARALFTSVPISVDLPTPGGPVKPMTAARPVDGNTSRTSAQPSGSSFSTSEMARASARFSPASRRSASSAAVVGSGGTGGRTVAGTYDRSPHGDGASGHRGPATDRRPGGAQDTPSPAPRRPADAASLHAPPPHAHGEVPAPDHPARAAPLPHALRAAAEARWPCVHRPEGRAADRAQRTRGARPLVLDRARHEDPLPRGRRLYRGEDGARPGVHH